MLKQAIEVSQGEVSSILPAGAAQELQEHADKADGSMIPKGVFLASGATCPDENFSHLLELDIRLGLKQRIETCAAGEVFRVYHHDMKAGALHVTGGGLEHFPFRVVHDYRAFALRPVQDIRDDKAAGLPRSYAGHHTYILKAVSFAQSAALPVDEKASVTRAQKVA